jgi:hypothetical protein
MGRMTAAAVLTLAGVVAGCAPAIHSTANGPLTNTQMAEFWQNPDDLRARDLFWGPWGQTYAPKATQTYKFVAEKKGGFSPGLTVVDEDGVEWSVKQGAEAQTEVVVSRILSAVGYHQPPVYYMDGWRLGDGPSPGIQKAGRFRPKIKGLKSGGEWSWQQNPFVGSDPYGGLLALMMLLNGTDLKNSNNTLYDVGDSLKSEIKHMYVVRDVGAALGETGRMEPRRGDPMVFAKERFIVGVQNGLVRFNYRGRHQEIIKQITVQDVSWMEALVSRLSPQQWQDAFRAGGYGPGTSEAFITRLMEKLEEARKVRAD